MLSTASHIINSLPYSKPFLFVDRITEVDENGITAEYTFRTDEYFYEGHFVNNPVTPGVILTECMAQISLAAFGSYLLGTIKESAKLSIAMSHTDVDFLHPVLPGEKVRVIARKEYFRFNKLKCSVKMLNESDTVVCKGLLSGMIKYL